MISMTDSAVQALKKYQTEKGNLNLGLRLGVSGGGCSGFTYQHDLEDQVNDGDKVFEREGVRIIVDPKSFKLLDGIEVDFVRTMAFTGFKFNNPKASATCGCGVSFNV